MAQQLDLSLIIKALDYASPVIRTVKSALGSIKSAANGAAGGVKNFNQRIKEAHESTAQLRDTARSLAEAGGVLTGIGLGAGYALKKLLDPAMAWQAAAAHVATAMDATENKQKELNDLHEVANRLSSQGVIANVELANSYYIARSNLLNHTEALGAIAAANSLIIGTTQDAAAAQAAAAPVTRMLTSAYNVFGDKSKDARKQLSGFADQFARLQTSYGFKDITEVQEAEQYAMPISALNKIDFASQNAALALISAQGKYAAEAGTAYEEFVGKLTTDKKLRPFEVMNAQGGVDLEKTLQRIAQATNGLDAIQRVHWLKEIGFQERSIQGVGMLIDHYQQFAKVRENLANSAGAADQAARTRTMALDEQFAALANKWDLFKESLGESELGPVSRLVGGLGAVLEKLTQFAEHHSTIAGYAVTFLAIVAAVATLGGVIALAASGIMGFASLVPVIRVVASGFSALTGATRVLTLAQGALNAVMALNPIALAVIGVVAFAAAAYEVYKHWTAIKDFFLKIDWKGLGANILKGIGEGILSGLKYLTGPVTTVAKFIRDHFPHSPAKLGPLRDLGRVRIVETIAQTMKPSAMATAVRRVAQVAAVAMPVLAATAAPALAAYEREATPRIVIENVTLSPRIEISASDAHDADALARQMVEALRTHNIQLAKELVDSIEREMAKRRRTEY
jgi:TP901 family phage tail tape measure protein